MTDKLSELNDLLIENDPEFTAWIGSLHDKCWARYDISACKLGWMVCRKKMADEIAELERRIDALEKRCAAVYKEGVEAAVIAGDEIERLRARVAELEAKPCPYVETSDEGTSYCRLAESNPDHNTASAE